MKGIKRFGIKGKLSPRYIGPFKILSQNQSVAFELELPAKLKKVHDVFHVSQLRKCLKAPEDSVTHDDLDLQVDLTYEEKPIKILEENWKRLRNRTIKFFKVQWKHHSEMGSNLGKRRGFETSISRTLQVHKVLTSGRSSDKRRIL
jgi:hypothetical protein